MNNTLEYTKQFLVYKYRNLDKSKVKNNFDEIELEDKISNSNNFEELHKVCKEISNKGLKQINVLFLPLKTFFEHLKDDDISFIQVDTVYIDFFINKVCIDLKLSYGTRSNYKISIVSFLNYIDKELNLSHKFNIEKIKVNSIKESKKDNSNLTDWLDIKELTRVNKELLKYWDSKDESLEKYRDILIFRLFCFGGILPNEMANLTLKSFAFKDNMMFLKIEGVGAKNREIPLPKEKLIRYYNKYLEFRNSKIKSFFYSNSNKKIEVTLLSQIVKRVLDFTNAKTNDKTPKMLRKTYALLLNNEKGKDGFTQPEQNIKYLLGLVNTTQLREILKYGTIDVVSASDVFEGLNL